MSTKSACSSSWSFRPLLVHLFLKNQHEFVLGKLLLILIGTRRTGVSCLDTESLHCQFELAVWQIEVVDAFVVIAQSLLALKCT